MVRGQPGANVTKNDESEIFFEAACIEICIEAQALRYLLNSGGL